MLISEREWKRPFDFQQESIFPKISNYFLSYSAHWQNIHGSLDKFSYKYNFIQEYAQHKLK